MNDAALNIAANVIITVSFAVALAGVLAMPSRPGSFMRPGIKVLLGGAMAIYVFVGLSHVLQFLSVTTALDIYENYLKVLFIPLVSAAAYAARMSEQLRQSERQARVLTAEHDMLMRVVDTMPNGVVVLALDGRIEFANDRAREMLELEDDPDTGAYRTPVWRCSRTGRPDLGCTDGEQMRDHVCILLWPDGTSRALRINATPIVGADGSAVGAIAAITDEEDASIAG